MNGIDIHFDVYSDTPKGKDPDTNSPTLRKFHRKLWSKDLPSGKSFDLDLTVPKLLHHKSDLGEFTLSSDSICHTYSTTKKMKDIVDQVATTEINHFFKTASTIGGYIIFPANRIDNKMTINAARGINAKIKDRFDLTLECIRRYYISEQSPLGKTLQRYSPFFNLFENFKGYVDFFLLNDLVNAEYSTIRYFIPFDNFCSNPFPKDIQEYKLYKKNMIDFVSARNQRIANAYNNMEL